MSANFKASTDGTQAIIGVGGVDQMTVSNAGVVTANSFVGNVTGGALSGNASSATALATGSTTARTLANRFADVVNVKDFGAVGDGVTDDTAAIQNAINSVKSIQFPEGTYCISNTLTINGVSKKLFSLSAKIQRLPSSTASSILNIINNAEIEVEGIIFDGNKSLNSNPINCVSVNQCNYSKFINCQFINAKVGTGNTGNGLIFITNLSNSANQNVLSCSFVNNDSQAIQAFQVQNLLIDDNYVYANGNGIRIDNMDTTFQQKCRNVVISNNRCLSNSGFGIMVGNYIENNIESLTPPQTIYGFGNLESSDITISANVCRYNGRYGIIAQGERLAVIGNICSNNSQSVPWAAGIGMSAAYSVVSNNVCLDNTGSGINTGGFGIDAGGSKYCVFSSNTITGHNYSGMNVGGTENCVVADNSLFSNNVGIYVQKYEGDGTIFNFGIACNNLIITGNNITNTNTTQYGIKVVDGVENITIQNNKLEGPDAFKYLILIAKSSTVCNNVIPNYIDPEITVDVGGNMIVPDIFDFCYTDTTSTVKVLGYQSMAVVGKTGIAWIDITNGGSGYTSLPTVTISGGGGSGATAIASIKNGAVTNVVMTNYGSGYTSQPTINFSGGGGSGITSVAQIGVPLQFGRTLKVYAKQTHLFNRVSDYIYTNIENKNQTNTTLSARCAMELKSYFGQWNLFFTS